MRGWERIRGGEGREGLPGGWRGLSEGGFMRGRGRIKGGEGEDYQGKDYQEGEGSIIRGKGRIIRGD